MRSRFFYNIPSEITDGKLSAKEHHLFFKDTGTHEILTSWEFYRLRQDIYDTLDYQNINIPAISAEKESLQ